MATNKLILLRKAILVSRLSSLASSTFSVENTIAETQFVDGVNAAPDKASGEAGKNIKLSNYANAFCNSGTFKPKLVLPETFNIQFLNQWDIKLIAGFSLGVKVINY